MTVFELPSAERLREEHEPVILPAEGEVGLVDIGSVTLENGAVIDDVTIAVQRWGELSPNRDNVVVENLQFTGEELLVKNGDLHVLFDGLEPAQANGKMVDVTAQNAP